MRMLTLIHFVFILLFSYPISCGWAGEQTSIPGPAPLSGGAASQNVNPEQGNESLSSDLVIRLGNESNQNDGLLGPSTYGVRVRHTFLNRSSLEGGYIRLHEPGSPPFSGFLDEFVISAKPPPIRLKEQEFQLAGTLWKNRTIDLYTRVAGVELAWGRPVSFNLGMYAGNAIREDVEASFIGLQFGISGSLGPVDLALSHLNGRIEKGFYRKTAASVSYPIALLNQIPLNLNFSYEDRYFQMGLSGPRSAKSDETIWVSGLEIHLGKYLR